jgi:hypothetical protein
MEQTIVMTQSPDWSQPERIKDSLIMAVPAYFLGQPLSDSQNLLNKEANDDKSKLLSPIIFNLISKGVAGVTEASISNPNTLSTASSTSRKIRGFESYLHNDIKAEYNDPTHPLHAVRECILKFMSKSAILARQCIYLKMKGKSVQKPLKTIRTFHSEIYHDYLESAHHVIKGDGLELDSVYTKDFVDFLVRNQQFLSVILFTQEVLESINLDSMKVKSDTTKADLEVSLYYYFLI